MFTFGEDYEESQREDLQSWCDENDGEIFQTVIPRTGETKLRAMKRTAMETQRLDEAKADRTVSVTALTVTVDGMTFDADDASLSRMSHIVAAARTLGISLSTTTQWVLADQTIAGVSVKQFAQVLWLAHEEQTKLWLAPYVDGK